MRQGDKYGGGERRRVGRRGREIVIELEVERESV